MSEPREKLLEAVETLQHIMIARATGEAADEPGYKQLRTALVADAKVTAQLPQFVRTCRDLGQFWSFIKPRFKKYEERRQFIREAFRPLLQALEDPAHAAPADNQVTQALTKLDPSAVTELWRRALERREADASGAITLARTLVESVCKHILDESGVDYPDAAELPALYGLVAEELSLAPSLHTEGIFKQVLSGCISVVTGLAGMRNKVGDAHGQGKERINLKARPRHAELAVNLAGALALFLVETWEEKPKEPAVDPID